MSTIWRRLLISLFASLALAGAAAAADCDALVASFKTAIADKAFDKLKEAMAAIADDSACNFDIDAYRAQEINSIIDMAGAAPTDDARKQMIEFVEEIMEIGGDWHSAEHLGDYHAARGEYADALGGYETAISFLSRPAPPSTPKDREELLARAAAAKSQASDDKEGRNPSRFAGSARDLSGRFAGIYSPKLLRGFEVLAVPLPINFYFGQARFTPEGEKAADELAGSGQGAERRNRHPHWPHRSAGRPSIQCRIVQTTGGGCARLSHLTRRESAHPGGRQGTGRAFRHLAARAACHAGGRLGARSPGRMGSPGSAGLRAFDIGQEWTMSRLTVFLIAAAAAAAGAFADPRAVLADDLRAPGGGTIRALVVGVDVYWRLPASVQLQGARADAEDIAEALRRGGVKPAVLFDADVTRAKIVAQMDSFVAELKPGDFVLFAFAGHGMQTPEYPRWQGIDADGVNEQIALSGFSFSGDGSVKSSSTRKFGPGCRAWTRRASMRSSSWICVSAAACERSIRAPARSARGSCAPAPIRSEPGKSSARNLPASQ